MVASPTNHGKSLRERCQVSLTITPISYRDWNKVHSCNCELVLVFEEECNKNDPTPPPSRKSRTRSLAKASHLVEVIPGLHIALVNKQADVPALRTSGGEPFTHIVQVSYGTPIGNAPLAPSYWGREEAPRSLGLVCPTPPPRLYADRTVVGPNELHAARDFLSLALPYGSTKWWPEEQRKDGQDEWCGRDKHDAEDAEDEGQDADVQFVALAPDYGLDELLLEKGDPDIHDIDEDVNVLIVAPRRRAVDVLSVLFFYLEFLEDSTPKHSVNYRDRVCKKVRLGPWSPAYLKLMARSN